MALETLVASAEASLIGSVLIEPKIVGEMMMRIRPEDFADNDLRHIYQAVRSVWSNSGNIDAVTVCAAAGSDKQPIIAKCMVETPTAASWEEYADIVSRAARLRRIQSAALRVTCASTLEDAEAAVSDINRNMAERSSVEITSYAQGIRELYMRQCAGKRSQYLKWGMRQLDGMLCVEKGDFVVIAGYPSAGKTMLATQFASAFAAEHKVGFFSYETSKSKLFDRMAAQNAKIRFDSIKNFSLSKDQFGDLYQHMLNADKLQPNFDFIAAAGMTTADIRAISTARRYDIIMIDYLQIVNGSDGEGSYERVTATSAQLQRFARSTGTTVIALSQLSRPDKGTKSKSPRLSDLRGSGQIEQDADVVMTLYLANESDRSGPRNLDVLKNRDGECGWIKLVFNPEHMRLAPEVKHDPPKSDRRARYKRDEEDEE